MSYQHLFWFYLFLWISPHLLLLPLAGVMFRKKLHKRYPIFFLFLLFNLLQFCIVFTMSRLKAPAALYVKVDLVGRIGDATLSFGIIQELLGIPLADLGPVHKHLAQIQRWITVALVLLASGFIAVLCYTSVNPGSFRPYWSIEALKAAQCGLLVLVFLWHRFVGVKMPAFSFGIALGIGLFAAVDLLMLALETFMVISNGLKIDIVSMSAFHAAVLIWFGFALVRENARLNSSVSLPQLHEHAAELGRVVHP